MRSMPEPHRSSLRGVAHTSECSTKRSLHSAPSLPVSRMLESILQGDDEVVFSRSFKGGPIEERVRRKGEEQSVAPFLSSAAS